MSKLFESLKEISVEHAEEIRTARKHGEKIANCKCSETVGMLGRACDYCRFEQIKDFNFVENALEMCK